MRRAVIALAGLAVLVLVWFLPPRLLVGGAFTGHMIAHMAVVAVASPLLALAVAGSRFDPSRHRAFAAAAVPLSLLELLVVWGWHLPGLHDLAQLLPPFKVLEQASFLTVGLLLWLCCLGYGAGERRRRAAQGTGALLLTSMHMTLLGALLALAPRPLYEVALCLGGRGLTPLQDQNLGGVVMLLVGGAVYLAGGLWLASRLLQDAPAAVGEG